MYFLTGKTVLRVWATSQIDFTALNTLHSKASLADLRDLPNLQAHLSSSFSYLTALTIASLPCPQLVLSRDLGLYRSSYVLWLVTQGSDKISFGRGHLFKWGDRVLVVIYVWFQLSGGKRVNELLISEKSYTLSRYGCFTVTNKTISSTWVPLSFMESQQADWDSPPCPLLGLFQP